ncbi:MAG: DUF1501 domain-containing protein [Pirellulaceae bacterium]|nr:DUF1501 domain-containing protein [Pirellulaceae bacterium]
MLNRRDCLRSIVTAGAVAGVSTGWVGQLAARMRTEGKQRHLVVLWMPGGPSQMDTFDMKPGHANGGSFKEIETSVPGMRFSEHLPNLAKRAKHLALVRSMQTKEGDHSRGTFLVRTGHRPGAPVKVPSIPAALSQELSAHSADIPDYVSILPSSFINPAAFSAGFLGAGREPLTVGGGASPFGPDGLPRPPVATSGDQPADLRVDNLLPPEGLGAQRLDRRKAYWDLLQSRYGASGRPGAPATHDTVYRRAMQLADSPLSSAFNLGQETDASRRAYGISPFGQGCLLARRLIEHGVPVVEVSLSGMGPLGWDSHIDNFKTVQSLSEQLDLGWSQLISELEERGLLESTTIAWMGEFGRTPKINERAGRDHFPDAWSCVLAGGGIAGGAIIGKTSDDGQEVVDRPVTVPDFLATIAKAVGVDPHKENISDERRPIKIADGEPIKELLT